MDELEPDKQNEYQTLLRVAVALDAQLKKVATATSMPHLDRTEAILRLYQALDQVTRKLHALDPSVLLFDSPDSPPVDVAAALRQIDELRHEREPTEAELELAEFVERMVAKHSTVIPDFDALYRSREELEKQIAAREPKG